MEPLLSLVVTVVIICVLAYVLWWIVDQSGLPDPPRMLLRVLVALIAFVLVLRLLLGLGPVVKIGAAAVRHFLG